MQNLILVGGGGHCKSCVDVIEQENKYKIVGILDIKEKIGEEIVGYKIIGTDNDIEKFAKDNCCFLITVGQIKSAELRVKLFNKIKSYGGNLATVISPRAYISKHAVVGEGTIVMHDAFINVDAKIGKNCIINTKALIEHECVIANNCHIAVGATLAGQVDIGPDSFVGANSTIIQGVRLSKGSFIKAGSLIK